MLAQLLYLAGTAPTAVPATVPALSSLLLSATDGSCASGTRATNVLNWSVADANDTFYETRIVLNGSTDSVLPCSTTHYVYDIGLVSSRKFADATHLDFYFDVCLVRKTDGTVLQTLSANRSGTYEACSG